MSSNTLSDEEIRALLEGIYPVSRETIHRLAHFQSVLQRWQAKTNLVSPGTLGQFWTRHVADSLQLLALKPEARRWTDLGSGGGFPGLVIAIALADLPDRNSGGKSWVNLVESISKKCSFLRQVANQTGAHASIHCMRIESAAEQLDDCEIITARALAPLERLLFWAGDHINGNRVALFPKGRDFAREIEECRGSWDFDLVEHSSGLDADSRILEISNARRLIPAMA